MSFPTSPVCGCHHRLVDSTRIIRACYGLLTLHSAQSFFEVSRSLKKPNFLSHFSSHNYSSAKTTTTLKCSLQLSSWAFVASRFSSLSSCWVSQLTVRSMCALWRLTHDANISVVIDQYTNPWASWSPHSLNFMLFTSVWSLLAVAYLTLAPTRFPRAAHKSAIAAVEFLTMVFWFAAFIAVAVLWRDIYWGHGYGTFHNCGVTAIVLSALLW